MEVGRNIREHREQAGISQEELARRIFVSRQTVSNWETGKTYPDVQSLLLLSNLFGVSVDSLVKGDVEAMQKEIENYELERFKVKAGVALSGALIAAGFLMLALLVGSDVTPHSPLWILAWGITWAAVAAAFYSWNIERKYDIKTIAEVKAFLDGTAPEDIPRTRKLPGALRVALQAALGAIAGIALMSLFLGLAHLIGLPQPAKPQVAPSVTYGVVTSRRSALMLGGYNHPRAERAASWRSARRYASCAPTLT